MPFQISPGVNVSEIDLTTVIPAVSTTEGGAVGHFRWGPVDKRVLISSEDALVQTFGSPDANTYADFFNAASFLAYGNKLYVVRTATADANNASAAGVGRYVKNDDDYENNYSSGVTGGGNWVAKYPGLQGNSLKVSICQSANAWSSTLTGEISLTNGTSALSGNGTAFTTELVVGDLLVLGPDREVIKVSAISNNTVLTLASVYQGNTIEWNSTTNTNIERRWEFYNFFDGAPGTSEYATTRGGANDELHVAVVDEDGEWTNVRNTVLERYSNVSRAADAKASTGETNYYKNIINQQSRYVWWGGHDSIMTSAGGLSSATYAVTSDLPQTDSLSGGTDGAAPTASVIQSAFMKFVNPEEVDVSFLLGGKNTSSVLSYVINNVVEVRKDCIICISPESADVVNNDGFSGSELEDVLAFRDAMPSSSYAVMDSGWKYMYDKYNDVYRYVPLNGDIAGLMVRTDLVRDPWFSPAGYNRGNVKNIVKLAWNPTKAERDMLYKKGVNPVVTFPGQGTVLFGDKTMLAKPSAFDRINVRRLFIVLEKAISTAAKFTLFEFNDDFTRAQFKNLVEPFLRDIQGRRGIYDFRVVCDESNNTGEVIDRNEFIGDIYIKPARSINFIQLNFVAVRTGVEFDEVVGQF